jgi:hypothetical protein
VLFICAFNLAIPRRSFKAISLVIITTMFIAVFTESVFVLYWKPNVIQVVLTTKLYLTFLLVYNLMCLCWYVSNSIIVFL